MPRLVFILVFTSILICVATLLFGSAVGAAADRVYPNAESVSPLKLGSRVPSVTVESLDREFIDLAKLLRNQGALLVFYRGGW